MMPTPSTDNRSATARTLVLAILASACAVFALFGGAASGAVTYKQTIGVGGAGALGFSEPAGVAINNTTGDVYVADRLRNRVQEFTSAGAFVRMWGFNVVASGEDDKPLANEVQKVKVTASGGMFRLNFEGQTTGGFGNGDLASGSPTVSNLVTATGIGNISSGNKNVSQWRADLGQWEVGEPISGPGIPAETVVNAVSSFSLELSKAPTLTTSGATLTSTGPFPFAVGQTIVGPGIPTGTKIIGAAAGTLTLTNNATANATGASLGAGVPYNATSGEVATVLNALPKISTGGGSVSVTGGPGDATGSTPYVVTFGTGPVAAKNVGQITPEGSSLGIPTGNQLRCVARAPSAEPRGFHSYQWLANGEEIAGATSSTYTTVAGDAGKSIQCRVATTFLISQLPSTTLNVSPTFNLGSPVPSPAPPEAPLNSSGLLGEGAPGRWPSVSGPTLTVGGSGGTLTCKVGPWSGTPTSYTYRWFRTGQPFGSPTTTPATSNELVLGAPDVAAAAAYQCQVTATNAGGSSTRMSPLYQTSPGLPGSGVDSVEYPVASIEAASGVNPVVTTLNGGPVLEVCKANPPSTDVCQAGVGGPSVGQFDRPRGVAVDNSPGGGGAVYVGDDWNYRVQKFTSTGTPILTWGKTVNKTTGATICTVASGDACGIGIRNRDATPGIFGGWPTSNEQSSGAGGEYAELGNTVSVSRGTGDVYVTDPYALEPGTEERYPRIQKFSSSGVYLGQVKTSGFTGSGAPLSVAVDSVGTTFGVGTGEQRAVSIFESPEFTPEGTLKPFAERRTFHEDQEPKQIAIDPTNDDKIWITDRSGNDPCLIGVTTRRAILAYDQKGHQLDCDSPEELGALPATSGMAISPSGLAYISVKGQNRIKVYELPQEIAPTVDDETVSSITTETAKVHATVNPGFEPTTYAIEYGQANCESNPCASVPGPEPVYGLKDIAITIPVDDLIPGTKYHYRIVAENSVGTVPGPDRTFASFPFVDLVNDPCPNSLPRKQTRTAGLLDCRAYELASADFTGGYDVVSDLAPGQTPFDGYPDAEDKLLYAVRDGGIPGTGSPTNRGPDPYVATRGEDGWSTEYVGIPADSGFSNKPFSSTLSDADSGLDTFAFSGPDICSPCFADGSSGAPLHLSDGSLVQGMAGSTPQLGATASGYIGDSLSADGGHFVFGSTSKFEPAGDSGGSIYDRNLSTKTTQVVSTLPTGATMTGGGVGELDISANGSRIVVAQKVSTDAKGNSYWHPYMHVGAESKSVDLAPGTTAGVLYAGMSADGTSVFFAAKDKLLGTDTDTSVDVYKASVPGAGSATLSLVSVKGASPSNSDTCTPPGEVPWNKASGAVLDCSAVVLGGGGGVTENGTIYFLSPELLEGPTDGKANQPNLFVLRPGQQPRFVATIDDSTNAKLHPLPGPPKHPASTLISGLSTPEALAVDESNGDIYVAERGAGRVSRYTSAGVAKNFTAVQPYITANRITGQTLGGEDENGIAFDSAAASPLKGSLYVTNNGSSVNIFSGSGEKIGALTGFGEACGVAIDQSTGAVFVGNYFGNVRRFVPISGSTPVTNANYVQTGLNTNLGVCEVGADNVGHAYAMGYGTGPLRVYNPADFTAGEAFVEGEEVTAKTGTPPAVSVPPSYAVSSDPLNGDLYVNNGGRIVQLTSSLTPLGEFGAGSIAGSRGVAVRGATKHAYAVNGSTVVEFGLETEKFVAIDSPMVVDAVDDNEIHRYGDFQTTPDGVALFSTKVQQSESYDNAGFNMGYLYSPIGEEVDCVSCLPTEGTPTGDASLPSHGLGITDDKRAFFNSPDQLVMRDTNGKLDAYEWKEGEISLISTGFSNAPSSLLTVTSNGKDAFFFTRETLVPRDVNGQATKLYDAREGGGFFVVPNSPPCAASDECHGAGTEAAAPPPIGSFRGVGGQHSSRKKPKCKKGFVRKHGKCVRKRRGKKNSHRKRAANTGRGGNR